MKMSSPALLCLALLAAGTLSPGCGTTVHQPGANSGFTLDPEREIDDAEIRRAFEARPQLQPPLKVAYLSLDPERSADLGGLLRSLPGLSSVYELPSVLVTGRRRYDEAPRSWDKPEPPSVRRMRLMAARAGCDVLIVFDSGHRLRQEANWLAAFNALLLPALFLPFLDEALDSYLEAFVIDVRNAYLYGHVSSDDEQETRYRTIYSDWADATRRRSWEQLQANLKQALENLLRAPATP